MAHCPRCGYLPRHDLDEVRTATGIVLYCTNCRSPLA